MANSHPATSQVTPRKYNATTLAYSDIPGATITETSYGGQHALRVSYEVRDGGSLDADGIANGAIVDPMGLATAFSLPVAASKGITTGSSGGLADTGIPTGILSVLALALCLGGLFVRLMPLRHPNERRPPAPKRLQ